MVKFACAHCGKNFEFKMLPIPDSGAQFQCSSCNKTSILFKRGQAIFCYSEDETQSRSQSAMVEMSDVFQSAAEEEWASEEFEARLQGLYTELPYDVDLILGIIEGPDQGTTHLIRKPIITIGKSNCDVNISDPRVSSQHCQIEIYGNHVIVLKDLQSMEGTYRNSHPVTMTCLRVGDKIQIGKSTLLLIQNIKKIQK
jgi:hypothetical protein